MVNKSISKDALIKHHQLQVLNLEDILEDERQAYNTLKKTSDEQISKLKNRLDYLERKVKFTDFIKTIVAAQCDELTQINKEYRKGLIYYAISGQAVGETSHGEVARALLRRYR